MIQPLALPPSSGPRYLAPGLRHVADLTDEELLGIDGPDADQVAPLPWAEQRSEHDTALAAEVGLRGLVAHGHVGANAGELDVPEELREALALRHEARAIVYADHSTRSEQETRILYVHDEVVLVEGVNGSGVHRFWVGDADAATVDLAGWCVPARHEGEGRIDGEDLPEELAGLQSAVFLDVVSLTGDEHVETQSLTFYRLADGDIAEAVEEGRLVLTAMVEDGVRGRVLDTVRAGVGAP